MHEIHLSAQTIFNLGPLAVSNALLTTWIGLIIILSLAWLATRKLNSVPYGLQNIAEIIVESTLDLIEQLTHDRKQAIKIFPFIATFFIFILLLNWLGLIPGIGSILIATADGRVPLLRPTNTELNGPLALALISVLGTQFLGITTIGFLKHIKHYLNLKNPIEFFVGILHFIGEIAKILSFSFRLFGNMFAGEILLIVITFLIPYVIPVPFYGLELFVGFIQALVFTMLTLVFIVMATSETTH